ncbi:MAG: 4-(cytidine 5'-diphospho)-2-C-methyl-D-erythritol kinase [Fibrobacterota bacterium]
MPEPIKELSPAKINLFLRVGGKRRDGFHEIETVFHSTDLCDEVFISECDGISVRCGYPGVPDGKENLAYKAAEVLRNKTGCVKGALIDIKKVIPPGGGLAGGSGNAAAVLRGLNRLWETGLSEKEIMKIAEGLGSDVSFCVKNGAAFGTGRGEILEFRPVLRDVYFIIVCPGIFVSTAWAYNQLTLSLTEGVKKINFRGRYQSAVDDPFKLTALLYNDFEKTVFNRYPQIARVKDIINGFDPIGALMSGSGSSVFGVFSNKEKAAAAAAFLSKDYPDTFLTEPRSH